MSHRPCADRAPKPGDWVVLPELPPWALELAEESRRVFEFCVGRPYPVEEIGDDGLLVLGVAFEVDRRYGGLMNDIRVEPELVVLARPSLRARLGYLWYRLRLRWGP